MKADDNNTFPKNLDFLAKILKGLNLNYTDVAKAAGITPQLVAYWFDHDDIKLSRLTYTMESLNISIECSFERIETQQEVQIKEDEYEIEMENVLKFKRETSRSGFILDQALESNANLHIIFGTANARLVFLAKLIKEMGLSLIDFSNLVNRKYQTIHHYFKVDDIKVSIIYDIARHTGRRVKWRLIPLKTEEH